MNTQSIQIQIKTLSRLIQQYQSIKSFVSRFTQEWIQDTVRELNYEMWALTLRQYG